MPKVIQFLKPQNNILKLRKLLFNQNKNTMAADSNGMGTLKFILIVALAVLLGNFLTDMMQDKAKMYRMRKHFADNAPPTPGIPATPAV